MGNLLSSAIKMQNGGGVTTATITLQLWDADSLTWTKNGVNQGLITGTQSFTLNAGDTFFATSTGAFGTSLNYSVNGVNIANYFGTPSVSSATFTAIAGNTYKFDAFSGA